MSDKNDDFLSFEKALRELKMRSEELKKLVSEGEIRAYRDGDSMKFRREDVATLHNKNEGATKLSMGDALEDDTGMVTEQISEEDTLLAEDDDVVVVEQRTSTRTRGARATPTVAVAAVPADREPGWVTAVAVLGFFVCLWGFALTYSISQEENPKDNVFAKPWAGAEK